MRTWAILVILLTSLLASPAVAGTRWACPIPSVLPQTLALSSSVQEGQAQKLQILQDYLSNLKAINTAYTHARSDGARNAIANCLLFHLATLHDNKALLTPKTRADGATWFLFIEETKLAINAIDPRYLRHSAHYRLVGQWLQSTPAYGPQTPYSISSR